MAVEKKDNKNAQYNHHHVMSCKLLSSGASHAEDRRLKKHAWQKKDKKWLSMGIVVSEDTKTAFAENMGRTTEQQLKPSLRNP
jgi:hypothetical protein